jgi:uncharacterized RDD family membrane protein YckC
MKCPKCGYNSFDHLESCKKCGQDMAAHKAKFGLRSLFFGGGEREQATTATTAEEAETDVLSEEPAVPAAPTDFGFDFMSEEVPDEEPLESTLDELLGGDRPEKGDFDFLAEGSEPGHGAIVDPPAEDYGADDSPDFDFAWEEEPLAKAGEVSGEDAEPEPVAFPDFAQDEISGNPGGGSEPPVGIPEGFDLEFESPPRSHEDIPEFVFEGEELPIIPDDPAGMSGEEAAGEGFVSMEKPSLWEEFDPASEDAADQEAPSVSPAAESFSWDDASREEAEEEEPGFPEPNLAELFLESLDDTTDKDDPSEAAPDFFAEVDPFGDISSEVALVETEHRDIPEDREVTGAEEPEGSGSPWEGEEEDAPEAVKAPPLTSRIGAGMTDLIILAVVFILFLAAGEVALGSGLAIRPFPSLVSLLELAIPYFLVLFAVCFGYFTLFHFLIGQTPGKMLFRIRVVGEEGGGLMFSQAFLRSVGGLLSLLPAGLGYLRIAFDRDRRGWNDRLANSRVVPVSGWENLEELREEGLAEEG